MLLEIGLIKGRLRMGFVSKSSLARSYFLKPSFNNQLFSYSVRLSALIGESISMIYLPWLFRLSSVSGWVKRVVANSVGGRWFGGGCGGRIGADFRVPFEGKFSGKDNSICSIEEGFSEGGLRRI